MIKKILFVSIYSLFILNLACSNAESPNLNANKPVASATNPPNLPEGLTGNQIAPTNEPIPGIPDPKSIGAANNSAGASSTPGIPDTTKIGKTPQPKNTPPIPGIPDEETLRKQMNTPITKEMMDAKAPGLEANSADRPNAKRQNARKSKPNR